MFKAYVKIRDGVIRIERTLDAPCSVFAEHQVAAIGECKCLFVDTLDGSLHGRAQRRFDTIQQRDQIQRRIIDETYPQSRHTALRMRRGDDALLAAQPREHGCMIQWLGRLEVLGELLLDKLP